MKKIIIIKYTVKDIKIKKETKNVKKKKEKNYFN